MVCVSYEKIGVKRRRPIFFARSSSAQTGKIQKVPLVQQVSTTAAQIKITKNSLENLIRKWISPFLKET